MAIIPEVKPFTVAVYLKGEEPITPVVYENVIKLVNAEDNTLLLFREGRAEPFAGIASDAWQRFELSNSNVPTATSDDPK